VPDSVIGSCEIQENSTGLQLLLKSAVDVSAWPVNVALTGCELLEIATMQHCEMGLPVLYTL